MRPTASIRRGLQQLDLAQQERHAGRHLLGLGIAVARWAAFQHVGDVDVAAAIQSDGAQHGIEQMPGPAHERLAASVLFGTGSLSNDQPLGLGLPTPNTP